MVHVHVVHFRKAGDEGVDAVERNGGCSKRSKEEEEEQGIGAEALVPDAKRTWQDPEGIDKRPGR